MNNLRGERRFPRFLSNEAFFFIWRAVGMLLLIAGVVVIDVGGIDFEDDFDVLGDCHSKGQVTKNQPMGCVSDSTFGCTVAICSSCRFKLH